MNLYLTNHANVRNTSFCKADGQVLYESETPGFTFTPYLPTCRLHRKTTIRKMMKNDSSEDTTKHLATIEWHTIRSSRIIYGGFEVPMSDFIPSQGPFSHQRVFAVPVEGRSFKWTLGVWRSTLELNDGSQTPVARGHRSNIGILGKPRQACLEIFPGFEHLVDIILVTYIFIEKLRKDRERDGRNAHI